MEDGQKKKAKEKWIPQLERNFRDFRTGVVNTFDIFKELEGKSAEIPTDINESKESFLLKYILTAVQDCYLKNADQDIILSAFGFLQEYENHGVQERHYEYCKWVGIRTKDGVELPLDVHWSKKNLHKQMNAKENAAINRLYKALVSKMSRNGGVLGYATDSNKIKEICSKTFPQPYYLQEKGYRKCNINGRIFYIPLTPAELRALVSSNGQAPTQDESAISADTVFEEGASLPEPTWGDSNGGRQCHTLEEVNAGALDGIITFNSLSNGAIGDERYFVGVRENTGNFGPRNVWSCDKIIVENKKEYVIRLYVHNNSKFGFDATARNVRVAFNIPQDSAKHIVVVGFINADNAYPSKYWSSVSFDSNVSFHLEYIPGSALLENNGIGKDGGTKLPDNIIKDDSESGALIGYSSLDGRIPSGFSYASYVTVKVKVVYDTAYTMTQQVRLVGSKDWSDSVDAKVGDKVEFWIQYNNTSSENQKDVMVRDVLPQSLHYVNGTTKLWNEQSNGAVIDRDTIATTGINIGHYGPTANAHIRFQAEVVKDGLVEGHNTLVNWAQISAAGVFTQNATSVKVK